MGIRGLTTFIANRSREYHERYELRDCYLVVDGNNIASQLYNWHCGCNDCFGGDYDKYANHVTTFYKALSECGVTPLVIFDGAYEKRKLKTVFSRMKSKIKTVKGLNSVTESGMTVFPLFLREIFVDITLKLNVQCMRCNFEGDSDAAYLARNLGCPILSYDSDFYIFDVLYIPFSTMDLRVRRRNNVNYIACEMYNVEKFLNSFGGLDKINLPLLAVLLGNDYIKRKTFSHFYRHLKMQKSKYGNEQQRTIKSVIAWLKNETPESAIRKILGRYRLCNRKKIANKIKMGINGYQCPESQICSYFGINLKPAEDNNIIVPNPEEIESINEDELSEDEDCFSSDSDVLEDCVSSDDDDSEEDPEEELSPNKHYLPSNFQKNYTKCLYPPCFMDIVVSHTYYCIPQIEDYSLQHSHSISLDILAAIYKILTFPNTRKLICVARSGQSDIKRFVIPHSDKDVPKFAEIENMSMKTKKKVFLKILNVKIDELLGSFPSSWHLYLISLKYWVTHSKNKVHMAYIISLMLCGIILNYVDSKVGFYRSTRSFLYKYGATSDRYIPSSSNCARCIMESLEEIDVKESICCMQKLIHYFEMDLKVKSNAKWYDVTVVHQFAEFQSCLLHIKYLNSLLDFPFPTVSISDFFNGTFLYNMTLNLSKRTDSKAYIRMLLEKCPKIVNTLELMVEQVEAQINSDLVDVVVSKRRKRKRRNKSKSQVLSEDAVIVDDSDEEAVLDPNNVYSLLSIVNT